MLRRRIAYGMALAAAILFQICYRGYFSHFVLVLMLCFPLCALALSLPGMLGCTVTVAPRAPTALRGGTNFWDLRVENCFLPLTRLSFSVRTENQLTGAGAEARRVLSCASGGKTLCETAETAHCGTLTCTISKLRICDLLGLFALTRRVEATGSLLCLPRSIAPALPDRITAGENAGTSPRPGGGGEAYDLRPYRPGDPLRSVHWKLSSKLDTLIVRETLAPRKTALLLTYDHFGTPDALDATLEALCAASRALLAQKRPHYLQWAEPVGGGRRSFCITTDRDLAQALTQALATRAPLTGKSILDRPLHVADSDAPPRHLHITPPDGAHVIEGVRA